VGKCLYVNRTYSLIRTFSIPEIPQWQTCMKEGWFYSFPSTEVETDRHDKSMIFTCFRRREEEWMKSNSWGEGLDKGKVAPVLRVPRHEGVLERARIAPIILYLGTRWRWIVSFTSWPLYPHGNSHWRRGRPQRRSGRGGEEKNSRSSSP